MMDGAKDSLSGRVLDPPKERQALFLERQSYRRRRLGDLARLLPVLGVLLLLVPLLWTDKADGTATSMSTAITYVFGVWAMLIAAAALFGVAARRWGGNKWSSDPET